MASSSTEGSSVDDLPASAVHHGYGSDVDAMLAFHRVAVNLKSHRLWLISAVRQAMNDLDSNRPVTAYERLRLVMERIDNARKVQE